MANTAALDYSPDWILDVALPDEDAERWLRIKSAEEWKVRERWFIGTVSLRVGSVVCDYQNVPLVDFGMALKYALNLLPVDDKVEFTIAGGVRVPLLLDEGKVKARIRGDVGVCEFVDLMKFAVGFMRHFIDECTQRYPDVLVNDTIERLFRECGVRELGRDRFLRHSRAVRIRNSLQQAGF